MISIIICSRKSDISSILKENIQNTIGCDYELVIIDNSQNKHSIFTAYNEGVHRAKGDILCFMHDDILYHTNGWGPIIQKHFQDDPEIGLIGVAGSHFMGDCPMYWWSSPFISQYNLENDNGTRKKNETTTYFHGQLADVVVADGLCLFIPSNLFNNISFDNISYNGFHGYDMDICMQVNSLNRKCCITRSILVEHFWSESSFQNKQYMQLLDHNLQIFYKKWKQILPIKKGIDIPEIVFVRCNNLCVQAYESKRLQNSKPYKLGRAILYLPKQIIRLFKLK